MRKSIFLILIGLVFTFSSCQESITGEGENITQDYDLTGFSKINSEMSADIYYTQAAEFLVSITAQPNILEVLEVEVNGTTLTIGLEDGYNIKNHKAISIEISSPEIFGFEIDGAGNISSVDSVITRSLKFDVDGSGNFTFPAINTETLVCSIDGSGDINIGGIATSNSVSINGSGKVKAFQLRADATNITINGSGNCELWVEEELNVNINGSGSVYYKGEPRITLQTNGSGRVIKAN